VDRPLRREINCLRLYQGYRPRGFLAQQFRCYLWSHGGSCLDILKVHLKGFPHYMKAGIHPAYEEVNVICACGHTFKTRSTHKGDIRVEICSNCHPFFTGRQKLMDTAGRVERFEKKYVKARAAKKAKLPETAKT